ncbi:MAG: penicillin acylase family protein [Polyangiaceae bacterium]
MTQRVAEPGSAGVGGKIGHRVRGGVRSALAKSELRLRNVSRLALRATLGTRLPRYEGEIALAGPNAPITIYRDRFGIPHVRATNDYDAFFGLGFCQGQDRAGQLEILVRTVRGTLSEVAGKDGLAVDRLTRRIGFKRAGSAQLALMRREIQLQIEAYAAGLHAGATRGATARAHVLALLGCEPTRWDGADVQAVSALMCFALASNWDVELVRLQMLHRDGPEALLALDAPYPDDLPASLAALSEVEREGEARSAEALMRDLEALRHLFPLGGASNAWAVAKERSATGRPLLAADPHLPPDIPVHWYVAHLATPEWRSTGAAFCGIPGFGIGHNDHAAWAVTAAHADNTDFFIEEIGPDGASVREGDVFVPCEVRREIIHVKGSEPVIEDVIVTKRGPIVGPAFDGVHAALSMSATWLEPRPYSGLFLAHKTRSRRDVHELFREASTSSVNLVYANVENQLAWRMGVDVPIRKQGHGTLPRPGWDLANGWTGQLVPFEKMPFVNDPASGLVASANNAPTDTSEPFFGVDFLDGYRQRAISEALGSRTDWSVAAFQELQRDTRSIPWEQIRDVVLATPATDPDAIEALGALATWDGRMDADSTGATMWALFAWGMTNRMVQAKAPHAGVHALGEGFHEALPDNTMITRRLSHLVKLLRERPANFFVEGWDRACEEALGGAIRLLAEQIGRGHSWAWGQVRPLRMHHPLGKALPALDYALGRPAVSFQGDSSTIHQAANDLVDPLGSPLGVPNLRMVVDVGAWENSRFSLLAGQSENPFSDHHFDQYEPWRDGGIAVAWTEEQARSGARYKLELKPVR